MIKGKYKIYLDGKLVAEQDNAITQAGKAIILKSILGVLPTVGSTIQMGIGNTPNQQKDSNNLISDTSLNFAVIEAPVTLSYIDNTDQNDSLVFKTTIAGPGTESYTIYELGLFPYTSDATTLKEIALVNGSINDQWKQSDGSNAPLEENISNTSTIIKSKPNGYDDYRVGTTALFLKATETIYCIPSYKKDLDTFGSSDVLSIAYSKISSSAQTLTVVLSETNSELNYSANVTLPAGVGYGIIDIAHELSKSNVKFRKSTSAARYSAISKLLLSSTGDVIIDAIRVNKKNQIDINSGMVSRTVLEDAIKKPNNSQIDIEYFLNIGFNI